MNEKIINELYVLVARTISHPFAALTREILFFPLEHKIIMSKKQLEAELHCKFILILVVNCMNAFMP